MKYATVSSALVVVHNRHFAEHLAFAQRGNGAAVALAHQRGDLHLAGFDQVDAVPLIALFEDDFPVRKGDLTGRLADQFQFAGGKLAKQFACVQRYHRCSLGQNTAR
jgi:hypothetical protein